MGDTETPQPAESRKDAETSETTESQKPDVEEQIPLPPPTFEWLVWSLKMQAEASLGLLHFGEEKDRPEPNLQLARHTIDTLGVLSEKTRGNLTLEEQRVLENSLTELRFRFVQISEERRKQK